ncbi:LuxR family transcriptional regulator [Bosea sp. Root483D1]|uniref:LuxR family transcriptional regulator n=1 Tax=Bosea sp. Root483D1 TaxID=1736544 RepID=UPI00138F2582|nr:LuxR family transcriptional regulator [Bosea sp. Root483D1]
MFSPHLSGKAVRIKRKRIIRRAKQGDLIQGSPMKSVELAYQELVDGLHSSAGEAEFERVGRRVAERMGFRYFAYLGLGDLDPVLISSYPKRWSEHYFAEGYEDVDPVIAFARSGRSTLQWTREAARRFPLRAQKRLFDDADEFGIRHGVSVAITGGFNRFAAFTFAVDEVSSAHGRMVTEANDIVQLIGLTFHAHADAKLVLRSPRNEAVPLTQRERECLTWAARGKSMEATAMIIGVTPRAVKFHLDNARVRLGAETLPQAVAIALQGGTIT